MSELKTLLDELTSGDEPRAEAAAVQFVSLGNPALYALAALLASPDADTRWWALRSISEFESPRTPNLLLLGLEDADPQVQACAALALRKHPAMRAIPQLIGLLGNQDQLLSRLGRDALVAVGTLATQELIRVVEDLQQPYHARLDGVRALAEIGDTDAIGTLFKVFQEEAGMLQYWAEEGLERMGIGMVFFNSEG